MAVLDLTKLKENFQRDMLQILDDIQAMGWSSPRFAQMMHKDAESCVEAALHLLDPSREFPAGTFSVPELTMEYYVIRAEYRPLFKPSERQVAWFRLRPEEELDNDAMQTGAEVLRFLADV